MIMIFLVPQALRTNFFFDDTLSPVYDDYNDSGILEPPTIEDKFYCHYDMPAIYDVYNDEHAIFSPSTIKDKIH